MSGDRKWPYQKLLTLAGLVYLAVIWTLAIWHLPKSQIENTLQQWSEEPHNNEVLYGNELAIVLWVCSIAIVTLVNTYEKRKTYLVYTSSKMLLLASIMFTFMSYKHDGSAWGGIILCLWASSIMTIMLSINYTWPCSPIASASFVLSIFILFSFIFSFPNTRIKDHYSLKSGIKVVDDCRKGISTLDGTGHLQKNFPNLGDQRMKLLEEEHKKAIQEIDRRSQIDDSWFHNKFILVGALFAAFLTYFNPFNPSISKTSEESVSKNRWSELTKEVGDMFRTKVPSCILGMACIVSLAIDLHMRSNAMITRQLGLWIKDFVECLLAPEKVYIGWERFLRIDINDIDVVRGIHMEVLFSVLDAAHLHFSSVYLYTLYLACLLFYFSKCNARDGFNTFLFIFMLVHVTLAIFAVGGNSFPSALEVRFVLWPDKWFSGQTGGVIPVAICSLVFYLALTRLLTLHYVKTSA